MERAREMRAEAKVDNADNANDEKHSGRAKSIRPSFGAD
jgi:hypothetical protein